MYLDFCIPPPKIWAPHMSYLFWCSGRHYHRRKGFYLGVPTPPILRASDHRGVPRLGDAHTAEAAATQGSSVSMVEPRPARPVRSERPTGILLGCAFAFEVYFEILSAVK